MGRRFWPEAENKERTLGCCLGDDYERTQTVAPKTLKRTCADCSQPLLVKNTFQEHFDHRVSGGYTYRCKNCQWKRVQVLIDHARRSPA